MKNNNTIKTTNNKNKNKKRRNRKRTDTTIANTKRILHGKGTQVYGFGRNVVIISKNILLDTNTFNRISLGELFEMPEFTLRKDYFKYFKVNNVVVSIYPNNNNANSDFVTLMFEWRNPTLVEGDILNNDSARIIPSYAVNVRTFAWRPPNTVIDNNFVLYMNKPQEIGYASEYPGWLYIKTANAYLRFTFAMNITFISNNLNYQPTSGEKGLKEEMKRDKYKRLVVPAKIDFEGNRKELEEEILEDWNEEEEESGEEIREEPKENLKENIKENKEDLKEIKNIKEDNKEKDKKNEVSSVKFKGRPKGNSKGNL